MTADRLDLDAVPWFVPAVGKRVRLSEPSIALFERHGLVPGAWGTVIDVRNSPTEYVVAWDGTSVPILHAPFEIEVARGQEAGD